MRRCNRTVSVGSILSVLLCRSVAHASSYPRAAALFSIPTAAAVAVATEPDIVVVVDDDDDDNDNDDDDDDDDNDNDAKYRSFTPFRPSRCAASAFSLWNLSGLQHQHQRKHQQPPLIASGRCTHSSGLPSPLSRFLAFRGGAGGTQKSRNIDGGVSRTLTPQSSSSSSPPPSPSSPSARRRPRPAAASALTAVSVAFLATLIYVEHGEAIAEFSSSVFDTERFKERILRLLETVDKRAGRTLGVVLYASLLALWETVGLSTFVLETSAGMAFGMWRGLAANVAGKIGGCTLAYVLGRTFFEEAVRDRLGGRGRGGGNGNGNSNGNGGSEAFHLVERSVERHPLRTVILMRASAFPTLVKNFGLAVMKPIDTRIYLTGTVAYLVPFSALWAAVGADSAFRLRAEEAGDDVPPANRVLNGLLLLSTAFMVAGSPTVVALWIRSLKKEQLESSIEK